MSANYEAVRPTITRVVVVFAMIFLLIRWACGTMLHQLENPPLRLIWYNFTAWLYRAIGMEDALLGGGITSQLFTTVLLVSGGIAILRPMLRLNLFLFWLCYLSYAMLFNVGTMVVGYSQAFLTLALIPFWAAPRGKFSDWWAATRYYACLAYGSAFLYKIFRGSFWAWNEGVLTTKANFASFFFLRPNWVWTRIVGWWLEHPTLLNVGYKIFILLEGLFLLGFFTRCHDRLLLWSVVILLVATLFFADANFLEMGAMVAVFVTPIAWTKLSGFFGKNRRGAVAQSL